MGIEAKLENLRNNNEFTHTFYDALVFNKMKKAFGGEVRFMSINIY